MKNKVEILAPAGNLSSLKAAADSGADVVYLGFSDATNARNFEGLNFSEKELREGVRYLRRLGKKFFVAINTFPQGADISPWKDAVNRGVKLGADALIIADMGVLGYARKAHPEQALHLSVQASAASAEAINFYKEHFNITRAVLPRVHSIKEIRELKAKTDVELEVFCLGGLCINIEGRCFLSSFVTGASTNTEGACSPSRFVRFTSNENDSLEITLNGTLLNSLDKDESSPYPTCCKGRYIMPDGRLFYAMEEPESLNALEVLPGLIEAGVSALKIEGRQRTKKYVEEVTSLVREAVDSYYTSPENYEVKKSWQEKTLRSFEGSKETLGAYGPADSTPAVSK